LLSLSARLLAFGGCLLVLQSQVSIDLTLFVQEGEFNFECYPCHRTRVACIRHSRALCKCPNKKKYLLGMLITQTCVLVVVVVFAVAVVNAIGVTDLLVYL
jgi:hypothetical protein